MKKPYAALVCIERTVGHMKLIDFDFNYELERIIAPPPPTSLLIFRGLS